MQSMKHTICTVRGLVILLITAVFITAVVSLASENINVALVKKTVNDVKKKTPDTNWEKAAIGTPLMGEDQVSTGKKSFALVKFSADNSIVRVREQSLLTVKGEGPRNSIIKEVYLTKGGVGFSVTKQRQNQEFRLTSPTSVASIRGTRGKWSRGEHADTLIVIEGLVNLRNRNSNREVDVGAGFIGISYDDGTIIIRPATAEELENADRYASADETSNEIKFELKDQRGNSKTLKLQYKE
jgi:hypothetical protein